MHSTYEVSIYTIVAEVSVAGTKVQMGDALDEKEQSKVMS